MANLLRKPYPHQETTSEILTSSSIVGFLLYILLIIYQPFGTSRFEHVYKYVLLFPYAVISTFSFCSISFLFSRQERKWTIGHELSKIVAILLIISCLSYLYNSLFLSKVPLSFENYLYMLAYTFALCIPVAAIYLLSRYIYLIKKYISFEEKDIPERVHGFDVENRTDHHNTELHIVADYENTHLKLEYGSFVYAESADNYCMIYFYKAGILQKQMIRISLTKLLQQVQTVEINRVHRSFIVNLKQVIKFRGNRSGYKLSIRDVEKEISISRNYIDTVLPVLKNLAFRP